MYTHDMKTTVRKWGNSLGIRIPKAFAVQLGIDSGKDVEITLNGRGMLMRPTKPTLEEVLKNITPKQVHKETDWGSSVGKETW